AIMPERVEDGIQNLRNKYNKNPIFRSFWNVMVHVISKLMKFDANYTPSKYIMNMAFIFIKVK
ncbi:MAG: hypothetical protein ACFFKA_13355, partial [Candidatus Thorarchaeota archaeon]